jgi:hypothetical protein
MASRSSVEAGRIVVSVTIARILRALRAAVVTPT